MFCQFNVDLLTSLCAPECMILGSHFQIENKFPFGKLAFPLSRLR